MAEKEMRGASSQRKAVSVMLCLLAIGFVSCGTIKGLHKPQLVNFTSPQPGVEFEVYNGAGKLVFAGKTPTQVMLKASKRSVSERYYVKSGGRVEVFQGDFALLTYMISNSIAEVGVYVDAALGATHSLQSEQELGSVYLNTPARIVGKIGGENEK
jgi:hypothetical protein